MNNANRMRALKPLLLGGAALAIVGLQPAAAQERSQRPGGDSPAASQPQSSQPSAGEQNQQRRQQPRAQERSQKGTTGQGSPAAEPAERATQDRGGDAKSPKADRQQSQSPDRDRNQAQDRDSKRDRDQAQDRDTKRDRDQAQDRDTKRDRNQAQDRDSKRDRNQARERDSKRDRDQARDRDTQPDRDQARDRDSDRTRDRDQARDRDQRQNRDAARAGNRQVSERERTRISTSIRQANVQPVRNVNFSVSVGAVVPSSVRFYPVTPAIVEVYPEYRGYQFVVVEDDIVIVEPRSHKIVTVIDNGVSGSSRAASRPRGKLSLSQQQRDVIRRSTIERRTTGSGATTIIERDYAIGDELPETIEFEAFPETIYTEVPEIRSYRYVVHDRDVYVIDPQERRVIEIIR